MKSNENNISKRISMKEVNGIIIIIFITLFLALILSSCGSKDSSDKEEEIPSVWADEDADIDDFDYYIDDSEIHLKGYNGRAKKVRIAPTYEIDGDIYNVVELNGTFALHSVDSVIVPEGVTKLSNNTFNSCGVKYVYLPSTLEEIPSSFLSYFHKMEKLYYGGSKKDWDRLVSTSRDKIDVKQIICCTDSPDEDDMDTGDEISEGQIAEGPEYVSIEHFSYELSGDEVIIDSYKGDNAMVEITPTYVIDGKEYKTNLSKFMASSKVKTWIFDEGITEIYRPCFNSTHTENIYFPSTMTVIYDDMLAYLSRTDEPKVKIYYGGSQEDWDSIFTEYDVPSLSDTEDAAELGSAIGSKLNQFIGHKYDSDCFEYFFNASPDDLK